MADFTEGEINTLKHCVKSFNNHFSQTVADPLYKTLNIRPDRVRQLLNRLATLLTELQSLLSGKQSEPLTDLPLLKRALMFELRQTSERVERRKRLTPDGPTKDKLAAELEPYKQLAAGEWFIQTEPETLPALTEFLVPSKAEEMLGRNDSLAQREFDEKFGILAAPSLFLPDLAYYRFQCCEMRRRQVSVAYLDIDDFKQFNNELTEPRVDSQVLPVFMRVLESATYGHGHVYRYGGDEYVMLLPNRGKAEAARLLANLQDELSGADYNGIDKRPTVSIGICEVTGDSFLTDRQIEESAAEAKKWAKDKGKNRIAGFSSDPPSKEGLCILHPATAS